MKEQEKVKFKKGFNHGWALSSSDLSKDVVEQLMNKTENNKSLYAEGFDAGVVHHIKQKQKRKSVAKLKETVSKVKIKSKPPTKKPPTKTR